MITINLPKEVYAIPHSILSNGVPRFTEMVGHIYPHSEIIGDFSNVLNLEATSMDSDSSFMESVSIAIPEMGKKFLDPFEKLDNPLFTVEVLGGH